MAQKLRLVWDLLDVYSVAITFLFFGQLILVENPLLLPLFWNICMYIKGFRKKMLFGFFLFFNIIDLNVILNSPDGYTYKSYAYWN